MHHRNHQKDHETVICWIILKSKNGVAIACSPFRLYHIFSFGEYCTQGAAIHDTVQRWNACIALLRNSILYLMTWLDRKLKSHIWMTFVSSLGAPRSVGWKTMELKMSVAVDRSRGKMRPVFIQASHVISPLLFIWSSHFFWVARDFNVAFFKVHDESIFAPLPHDD
jgi:hypothetical protein